MVNSPRQCLGTSDHICNWFLQRKIMILICFAFLAEVRSVMLSTDVATAMTGTMKCGKIAYLSKLAVQCEKR